MPESAPRSAGAMKMRTQILESEGSRKRRTQERQGIKQNVALIQPVELEREPTANPAVHAQRMSRST